MAALYVNVRRSFTLLNCGFVYEARSRYKINEINALVHEQYMAFVEFH